MSWCELKVTGLLGGPVSANTAEIKKFRDVFPDVCPSPPTPDPADPFSKDAPWPNGLVLPNYTPGIWISQAEQIDVGDVSRALQVYQWDNLTQLTFHAQLIGKYAGTINSNKEKMLKEVAWFYYYCDYKWLKDLKAYIKDINETLKKSGRVINPVDVRDWKWYCGNGAGD